MYRTQCTIWWALKIIFPVQLIFHSRFKFPSLRKEQCLSLTGLGSTLTYVFPFRALISFYPIIKTFVYFHLSNYKLSEIGDTCHGLSRTKQLLKYVPLDYPKIKLTSKMYWDACDLFLSAMQMQRPGEISWVEEEKLPSWRKNRTGCEKGHTGMRHLTILPQVRSVLASKRIPFLVIQWKIAIILLYQKTPTPGLWFSSVLHPADVWHVILE